MAQTFKIRKMKKGQIWISAILYLLIITVVMAIVINAGKPILGRLQDKTTFTRTKNLFSALNEHIKDVGDEGAGSQRVVPIELEAGQLKVQNGMLQWDLHTDARILDSGSEIDLGDLYISSNADVSASSQTNTYLLQNSYVKIYLDKCETQISCSLNSSQIIKNITFINPDTGVEYPSSGNFDVGFGTGGWNYSGYSKLEDVGVNMGSASVVYLVNNSDSSVYTIIEFTLESNCDFIQVKIR